MELYFFKQERIIEESTTTEVDLKKLDPTEQSNLLLELIDLVDQNTIDHLVNEHTKIGDEILKEHVFVGHIIGIKKILNTILTELDEDELKAELEIIYKKYIPE